MKISEQQNIKNLETQISSGVNGVRTNALNKRDVEKSGYSDDPIEVSDRAKEFGRIKSALNRLPDIREEKVKEVSAKIQSGSYRVDAELVASAILKESILDKLNK